MARTAVDDLMELERPIVRLFDSYFPWAYRRWPTLVTRPFMPAADVFEKGEDLVIRFEVPGIDPGKDVTVTIDGEELTIKGERKEEKELKEEGYYRKETFSGAFERRLPVPKGTSEKDIAASYADGILEIVVAGGAKPSMPAQAKHIPVKATVKTK